MRKQSACTPDKDRRWHCGTKGCFDGRPASLQAWELWFREGYAAYHPGCYHPHYFLVQETADDQLPFNHWHKTHIGMVGTFADGLLPEHRDIYPLHLLPVHYWRQNFTGWCKISWRLILSAFQYFANRRSCRMYRRNILQGLYLSKLFAWYAYRICSVCQQPVLFFITLLQG